MPRHSSVSQNGEKLRRFDLNEPSDLPLVHASFPNPADLLPPPIISVENLGKSYLVGQFSADNNQKTLSEQIGDGVKNFYRKAVDIARGRQVIQGDKIEEFWALKDVNFEVNEGEITGVIGRNGAGKSTLLKVLSQITEPTTGRITLRGRVASLLEVGTGFHPELSGRENIYLNGAILGMHRTEIKRKFDEIVSFAGVDKFLDTPVKRYSSGMYVRLAFAVAAHLDPEILVVDEVLAVGDAEFQKKCIGKMQSVAAGGRTVLFVSHNMSAIRRLCDRCLLLDGGRLEMDDECPKVIQEHLKARPQNGSGLQQSLSGRHTSLVSSISINQSPSSEIAFHSPLQIDIQFSKPLQKPRLICAIYDSNDQLIIDFDGLSTPPLGQSENPARGIQLNAAATHMLPGEYYANILITAECLKEPAHYPAIMRFRILDGLCDNHFASEQLRGIISAPFRWNILNEHFDS